MPKKAAAPAEPQAPAVDPQKKYLMDQFEGLMEQVGEGFGGPLQEELIRRLERTIADFHEEVSEMLTSLRDNSEKRHEQLKEILNNPEATVAESAPSESDDDSSTGEDGGGEELSDWEKRLEGMDGDGGDDAPPAEEEKPKKKGFFGRKKK